MKPIRLGREEFLGTLQCLEPGLSPPGKKSVSQSHCFAFRGGRVQAFNGEISCSAPSPLPENYEAAVPAKPLLDQLGKLDDKFVSLSNGEGGLLVQAGDLRKFLVRSESEVVLPLDAIDVPLDGWSALDPEFCEAIGVVRHCAGTKSKDGSMYAIACVHVHPDWVEASDNTQICRWKVNTGVAESVLLAKEAVAHVPTLGMTEFAETNAWMHFRRPDGLVLSCRRDTSEYEDFSQYLKVKGNPLTLPKGLVEETGRASVFSDQNADDKKVRVDLAPGRITLRGEGPLGWYEWGPARVNYDGPALGFLVLPELLKGLVQRHSECIVSGTRLKVVSGKMIYVACLFPPGEKRVEEEPADELPEETELESEENDE